MSFEMETKQVGGRIIESDYKSDNPNIGIIKGYIATWDADRGNDKFTKGCFTDSLNELKKQGRPIRLKDNHGRTIGGFPIDTVVQDEKGLYAEGNIDLEVQQGKEAYSMAKKGFLSDFSIGFSCKECNYQTDMSTPVTKTIRVITKANVWEGSIVDEPMNPKCNITEVKSVTGFQNLPLADRGTPWDSGHAVTRIRDFTGSVDSPSPDYKKAFLWYDAKDAENFTAYKCPIADIIDGQMVAVPRAIFAVAAALRGARSGLNVPTEDKQKMIAHVEKYYEKMGLASPWGEGKGFRIDDFSVLDERVLEDLLNSGVWFSGKKSKAVVSAIKSLNLRDAVDDDHRDGVNWDTVLSEIKSITLNKE